MRIPGVVSDWPGPISGRWQALAAGAALFTGVSAFACAAALAQDQDDEERGLTAENEEVIDQLIVTGRKRQEFLKDVPSSVSVVQGEAFEQFGGRNLRDLELQLVNVDFFDQSNLVNNIVGVRGIGTNARSAGLETGTSYYLDGVLLNRPGLFSLTTNDLASIEVYRGPQGTEFGRNALAGVFFSVSAKPTDEWEYEGMGGYGNFDFYETSHVISGPLVDDVLGIRASVQRQRRGDGYIMNFAGQDAGTTDQLAARVNLTWTPSQSTTVELIGNYASDTIDFNTVENFLTQAFGPDSQFACEFPDTTFVEFFPGFGFELPCVVVAGPRTIAVADPVFQDVESWGVQLNIDHVFENGWAVRSINAYYDNDTAYPFSLSPGPALSGQVANFDDDAVQYSTELQIISPKGSADGVPWDFVAGLFYFHEDVTTNRFADFGSPIIAVIDGNGIPTGEFIQTLTQFGEQDLDSYAAYVNGNYYIDRFTINLGFRISHETRSAFLDQDGSIQFFIGRFIEREADLTETVATGTASLQYEFSDEVKGYVKWARGFKPGGVNLDSTGPVEEFGIPTTVDNESSDLFEIGLRSRLDPSLTVNVTGFYQLYRNQQTTILLPGNPQIDRTQPDGNIVVNIGDGRSFGFEVDVTYVPVPELVLSGSYGYTNARFYDTQTPTIAVEAIDAVIEGFAAGIAGSPLPFARPHSLTLNATYTWQLGNYGSLALSGNFSYRAARSGSAGSGLASDDAINLNTFLTFTNDAGWLQIEGWARNLTNETYLVSVFGNSFTGDAFGGSYSVPREYGGRVRVFWN